VVPDKNHKAVGWSCSFARGLAAGPQFKVGLFPKILELEFGGNESVLFQFGSVCNPVVLHEHRLAGGFRESLAATGVAESPEGL